MTWVLGGLCGWYLHKVLVLLWLILRMREQQRLAADNAWPRLVRHYESHISDTHRQLRWAGVVWLTATFALLATVRNP